MALREHTAELDSTPVFWREAPGDGAAPVLYLHGVPTSSDDWIPFLERTGGLAPDLPGFGRSGKPGSRRYDMEEHADWIDSFLAQRGAERERLVMHDWGVLGLVWAQRAPERVERLVVMNAVPLLPGYRWHRIARVWRTRGAGELFMGATTRWGLKLLSREASATPGPLPHEFLDATWSHFDQGTQRAILRLYRSAPPVELGRAGARLGSLSCPALVLWGERDPYIAPSFAAAYTDALGGPVETEIVGGAGHWPWLDRPEVIDRVAEFLDAASR